MIAILQLLVISTISAAFARRVFARWEPEFATGGERLLFEYAAGLGLLGLVMFALGALQLFYVWSFVLVLIAMAALGWNRLSEVIGELTRGIGSLRSTKRDTGTYLVVGLIGAIGVLVLVRALAPPLGDDWDSLAYHLAIPKLYLSHGGIYYVPFASHSNFPFTWEMLYTLGLGFGSIALAKLFHFAAWILLLWATHSLARRYFSAVSAGIATLVFAGIPIAAWEATSAYVDLATALYTLLVVYALLNYSSTRDRRWALAAGLLAGIGAGTKMTALAMIGVAFVWVLWPEKGEKLASRLKLALGTSVVAALVTAPWYIKTLIYTGSPVYPFLYGVFGGRNWSGLTAELYRADQLRFGVGHGTLDFLRLPWDLFAHFARFHDYGSRMPEDISLPALATLNPQMLSVWVGPAVAAMFLLAPFALTRRGAHRPMLAAALALVVMWFVAMQNVRYLIPALALFVPAVAWAAEQFNLRRVALVVAAASSLLTIYIMWNFARPALPVALGVEPQSEYLAGMDLYRTSEFINREIPRGAKVALFGETRGFYLDRPYFWADSGHNAIIPQGYEASRIAWLAAHGYRYILVNHRSYAFQNAEPPAGLEELYMDLSGQMSVWKYAGP